MRAQGSLEETEHAQSPYNRTRGADGRLYAVTEIAAVVGIADGQGSGTVF